MKIYKKKKIIYLPQKIININFLKNFFILK